MRIYQGSEGEFYGTYVESSGMSHATYLGHFFEDSSDTRIFLQAIEQKIYFSDSYSSHRLELAGLSKIGAYFRALKVARLPRDSYEWQKLVDDTFEHHFLQNGYALRRLTSDWTDRFKPIFEHLRSIAGLIPVEVDIPPRRNFRITRNHDVRPDTVIDGSRHKLSGSEDVHKVCDQLVNLDISRTDAEYLEGYRNSLTRVRAALEADARNYLESINAHLEYGRRMRRLCSAAEAQRLRKKYMNELTGKNSGYHVMKKELEPDTVICETENSLARILRLYETSEYRKKVNGVTEGNEDFAARGAGNWVEKDGKNRFQRTAQKDWQGNTHETFNADNMLPKWNSVKFPVTAPCAPSHEFPMMRRFQWMMGYLTPADLGIFHLYLSLRNPVFNPVPLFDAEIKDKLGRSKFSMTISGESFEIDKRRVPALKKSSLDAESVFAINLLLKMTDTPRKAMSNDHPLKNRLFFRHDELGARPCLYASLYSFDKRCARSFMPLTIASGLPAKNISPMRLRRSTAVLEWLRTGSVTQAARKIGNTTKVVIRHYIPPALLASWNTRLTRRFQNLTLVVAASKDEHLLASTDFSSVDELKRFVEDMLCQHTPSSSQLAQMLHERLAHPEDVVNSATVSATSPSSLLVPIDAHRLAILYAFRDHNYADGISEPETGATGSRVIPNATLVDLADLLNTKLPDHHDPAFRAAHWEAQKLSPRLAAELRAGSMVTMRPMDGDTLEL